MNILHFSDTHLGYHYYDKITEEGVNAREQDFYDAFSFIIDRIVEQRPDLVLHSGDFFHRPSPSNRAITFALEQLSRVSMLGIPFVLIAGNHSTPKNAYTAPILKAFESLPHIYPIYQQKYEMLSFGEVCVHGLPHINDPLRQADEIANIQATEGKKNILMLHTSLGTNYYMSEELGIEFFPSASYPLLDTFDYIALGHWHNYQQLKGFRNACYSGSTERLSESEISSKKGYCTLQLTPQGISTPTFHAIPTRTWHKWHIGNCHEKSVTEIRNELLHLRDTHLCRQAIISLHLSDLKTEQRYDLAHAKVKEIFEEALVVNLRSENRNEAHFFSNLPAQQLENLETLFESFLLSKNISGSEQLLQKARSYFEEE